MVSLLMQMLTNAIKMKDIILFCIMDAIVCKLLFDI